MGRKGRVNKNNAAAGKTVEQDVPKEEPVPEPPKEPEMSLGEKKLLKQREKEQREEQERLKREAQAAQLLKQESKAHAKKSKSKSQKIKLDRNFSESSQQSSPEKVVQPKERKVPSEQISLKEEIQVKQEPEPIQSSQNVYRNEPSIDSDFAGNTTMKNESDDWADEIDEHCSQFNAGPSKTDNVPFFSDNKYQNRDNQGSGQWQNTYYNRSRQPNRDGSTSNFQQERSGYRGPNRNPRRGTDYHNDNINSRERGNDHGNYQQGRGSRNSRGGTDYHTDTKNPRGGTEYTDNRNSRERGNNHRGSNYKKTRGFSNSLSSSDRGSYNRGNQQRYSQHWNSQPQHYDNKPSKTNYGDSNNSEQDNWDNTLKVDEWQAEPQNTENQQSVPAATQDTFTYASSAQDNYDGQPNYYTQPDNSGYMGTQSYQTPEETENLNCNNPPSQYTGDYNTASSDYQIQNDHDSSWDIQPTPDQSLLNTSAGDQDLKLDFPELPQSQAKPYFNQSDDQKITSRNQSNEPSWRDSNRTPKSSYNNHRDRNQSYEQDAGNYSADKKRKNESFNSSADSSFNRSGYNNSYNKRDSYSRFSDREDRSRNYGNKYCPAERKDIEFCKFNNLRRQDGPINNGKLREETGDLFDAPVEYSLAHCVAEDMSMGAGIAKTFRMKFGRVPQLLDQDARTGGLAVLEDKERFLYYLVTKERSQGKPTMYTMWLSLNKLRDHCEEHGVKKLAIPQIGCGLDKLYWSDVKQLLEYVFRDVEIEIVVYTLEGEVEDRKVKKCFINHQKLSLKDIALGTGHIYFGYCDGTVTDDITSLSSKFNILTAYKSNRKEICEVIRTEGNTKNDDVVYGVIIKQTPNEKLSFTKLDRALRNLSKFVKKDEYNYVGFQAFVDEKDEQIIDKITTIMQYALKDVEIWVCWPKEIEAHCPPQPNRD